MDPSTLPMMVRALAASCGVLSHLTYFIQGEHHKQAMLFLKLAVLLPTAACLLLTSFTAWTISESAWLTGSITATYLGAVWISMILYRSFFHRLHHFPGPRLAKVSKFYHLFSIRNMDSFRQLDRWHRQYGSVVRIGPGEVSIVSPNAAFAILGPGGCGKSPWYDYGYGQPLNSLHSTRDNAIHESRRRIWDHGFSSKALRDYEGRVVRYTSDLIDQIRARAGEPINASKWFNYYSFDVMGDLAFGKSFDMLKNGETHFVMKLIQEGLKPLGFLTPVPWAIPIMANAPLLGSAYRRLFEWCAQQVDLRQQMKVDVPDIASWLFKDPRGDRLWLNGDSRLIIVAGSDTTAIAMTHLFYHLAADPSQVDRLRAELSGLIDPKSPFSVRDVQNADHLNGVINEALRLHPPVPSGVFRKTPRQGITVDGIFIPGDVNVTLPHYVIGRSEECWVRPNEFIPERWYSRPDLIKNKNAFVPFSFGPFGCIGKQLALMEIRTVACLLIDQFDVRFAPNENGFSLLEKSTDTFTMRMGDLNLLFEERVRV